MARTQEILNSDKGAKLEVKWGLEKLVASLVVTGDVYYRGEGLTLNEAITALNADIDELDAQAERKAKARKLIAAGQVSKNGHPRCFYVQGSERAPYVVNLERLSCTCPDYRYRSTFCKHLEAAQMFEVETRFDFSLLVESHKMYHTCREAIWVSRRRDTRETVYTKIDESEVITHCAHCGEELREADLSERIPSRPRVQEIRTSGGSVTIEGTFIASVYCDRCHRGGAAIQRQGAVVCGCGATIARKGEIEQGQREQALPVDYVKGAARLFKTAAAPVAA